MMAPDREVAHATLRERSRRLAARFCYLYVVLLIGVWLTMRYTGDEWWGSTLLLFGPRWVLGVPLLLLFPFAIWSRSARLTIVLLFAGLMILGPITDGTFCQIRLFEEDAPKGRLRILTCNTDGRALRDQILRKVIAQTQPDIVAVQEGSSPQLDAVFPPDWHACRGPSGLRLHTRYPVRDSKYLTEKELGMPGVVGVYHLVTSFGAITVVNVHLPTPRDGFELFVHGKAGAVSAIRDQTVKRDIASAHAREWLGELEPTAFVAGDFNLPVESAIFRRYWADLNDAFDEAGLGWGFTKQTRWFGVRIDHVLAGNAWRCRKAWVGPDVGSDHLPLLADFEVREN